jgi:predicted metal-dependent hydrolase
MLKVNRNNFYQRLADRLAGRICRSEGILPIKIEVKEIRRGGRACNDTRRITIPLWANRTKEYFVYYVIHELTHIIRPYGGHNQLFKTTEQAICKRYNIKIQYKKAYPKFLYEYKTGKVLCGRHGQEVYQSYNGIMDLTQ